MSSRLPLTTISNGAFVAVLLLLLPLGAWWTVLIARLVNENHDLRVQIDGDTPAVRELHDRRRLMMWGESGMMAGLSIAVVGLSYATANRERSQLRRIEGILAASTHELKTPLAGVRALLESLAAGVLPPEQMAPHLQRGLQSCDRLEHLVDTVLVWQAAVANPENPGLRVEARPLSSWLAPDETVITSAQLPDPLVFAAPDALRVVWENLLENARKYGGTTLVLDVEVLTATVQLHLRDDGIGFEPAESEKLFEPYQRLHTHTRGTGLGLHISRSLARGMQGDLTARSDGPGRGAVFTLTLRRSL